METWWKWMWGWRRTTSKRATVPATLVYKNVGGLLNAAVDMGLGGKVDDRIDPVGDAKPFDELLIANIPFDK